MKRILLFAALLGAGCSIDAGKTEGKEASAKPFRVASFLPENNYHERSYYQAGEVTEQDFDAVLYAAEEIYGPIFEQLGLNLTLHGDWKSTTVNAYCSREGDDVDISLFGGLARQKSMTTAGLAIVVCHEIGHALGGRPFYSGDGNSWAAVEGQSDYFATAACARKMFDPSSPLRFWGRDLMRRNPSKDKSQAECGSGSSGEICRLSMAGGLSLGSVLAELGNEKVPSYDTPSKVVVKKTMETHPPAQCRLDSYKVGALCNKNWEDSIIPSTKAEENTVSCSKPKCWYRE